MGRQRGGRSEVKEQEKAGKKAKWIGRELIYENWIAHGPLCLLTLTSWTINAGMNPLTVSLTGSRTVQGSTQ